jgi:hypothetical protein
MQNLEQIRQLLNSINSTSSVPGTEYQQFESPRVYVGFSELYVYISVLQIASVGIWVSYESMKQEKALVKLKFFLTENAIQKLWMDGKIVHNMIKFYVA